MEVLHDQPRSGRPTEIHGIQRAKIIALACSEPPEGYAQWSLQMLADKVVELGYCEQISHTEVGKILKKNKRKPHLKKTWCIGKLNSRFLAQMEQILWLYEQPYDPRYPVICLDERPCFLIGNRINPLAMQAGQVRKEHYACEKHGSCTLFAAIEPLTGFRLAQVHRRRTKKEYTLFFQSLADQLSEVVKIRVVQDNLNTHALANRFEFFFTSKSASWLKMIEIEFSVLTRQCLDRRIPRMELLEREVLAIVVDRTAKNAKINWQFSIQSARSKLNSHYVKVHLSNTKFNIT